MDDRLIEIAKHELSQGKIIDNANKVYKYLVVKITKENKYYLQQNEIVSVPMEYAHEGRIDCWCEQLPDDTFASYIYNYEYFEAIVKKNRNIDNERMQLLYLFDLKDRDKITEFIANWISKNENVICMRVDTTDEFWYYLDGIWRQNGASYIMQICRQFLKEKINQTLIDRILLKIKCDHFVDVDEFLEETDVNKICLMNGVYDFVENRMYSHSHKYKHIQKHPINFKKEASCEQFVLFLQEIMPDYYIPLVQEYLGFCFYREYKYKKAIMFRGKGDNGKSKLLDIIRRLIGKNNLASIPLRKLSENQFSIINLFGKNVNIAGDLDGGDIKNTGYFKQITGGDLVDAERKFKNPIHFVNYAKLMYSTNTLPNVYDVSEGFWERWILIDCPNKFVSQKELDSLKPIPPNYKLKNPERTKDLFTEEIMSGIFNWSMIGLRRLIEQKGFSESRSSKQIMIEWQRASNSFQAFIIDCCDFESHDIHKYIVTKQELFKLYVDYCNKYRSAIASEKSIHSILATKGVYEDRIMQDGDNKRCWIGIKFNGLVKFELDHLDLANDKFKYKDLELNNA